MRLAICAALIVLASALIGCQVFGGGVSKPAVVVNSPPSGSEFTVGDDVQVNSTATDTKAITRVDLLVDGVAIRTDPSPVAQGQANFSLVQTWKATGPGNHTLVVRAYNASGAFSDAGLSIVVKELAAESVTETPTTFIPTIVLPPTLPATITDTPELLLPTLTPTGTATSLPEACSPNSLYIADVTIPDGTTVQPGFTFVKIWRARNTGTCAWDSGYSIAFSGGTPFVAGAAPVPAALPGAEVDISLTMTAPTAPGSYVGRWRLKGPDGSFFGTLLTTAINVQNPNPPTSAAPTATSSSPTQTPLPGAPVISSFTCSPCTIVVGSASTLAWGAVANATSVTIDEGIGGVATPGSQGVSPGGTTTYTLTATGGGGTSQATVTVVVVGNFGGHWEHNFGFMDLTQSGANVTGTFHNTPDGNNGTLAGTVSGNVLTGTYQKNTTGPIQFSLGGTANTFTGNFGSIFQWCGARSGVSFPSGCAFDGHWNTRYNAAPGTLCLMDLSQVGSAVTGTYCNGTIQNGTIAFSGGFVVLSGTWHISNSSNGSFKFFLPVYTSSQFQGNYDGSIDWCGWRNSSTQPAQCEKN